MLPTCCNNPIFVGSKSVQKSSVICPDFRMLYDLWSFWKHEPSSSQRDRASESALPGNFSSTVCWAKADVVGRKLNTTWRLCCRIFVCGPSFILRNLTKLFICQQQTAQEIWPCRPCQKTAKIIQNRDMLLFDHRLCRTRIISYYWMMLSWSLQITPSSQLCIQNNINPVQLESIIWSFLPLLFNNSANNRGRCQLGWFKVSCSRTPQRNFAT